MKYNKALKKAAILAASTGKFYTIFHDQPAPENRDNNYLVGQTRAVNNDPTILDNDIAAELYHDDERDQVIVEHYEPKHHNKPHIITNMPGLYKEVNL